MGDPILAGAVAKEVERRFTAAGTDVLPINQSELANQVGVHRVSVNRAIQAMVAAGVIRKVGPRNYQLIPKDQRQAQQAEVNASTRAGGGRGGGGLGDQELGERILDLMERLMERQNAFEDFMRDFMQETLRELIARFTQIEQELQALATIISATGNPGQNKSSPKTATRSKPHGATASLDPRDFDLSVQEPLFDEDPQPLPPAPIEQLYAAWNAASKARTEQHGDGLPPVKGNKPNPDRRKLIATAWQRSFDLGFVDEYLAEGMRPLEAGLALFSELFARANASEILRGNKKWRASLDFVLRPDKMQALIEGVYVSADAAPELDHSKDDDSLPVAIKNDVDRQVYAELVALYGEDLVKQTAQAIQREAGERFKPFVSRVKTALRERFGGGDSEKDRRIGETHLEYYDRINNIDPTFDDDMADLEKAEGELPFFWLQVKRDRAEAAKRDQEEGLVLGRWRPREVIEGKAERLDEDGPGEIRRGDHGDHGTVAGCAGLKAWADHQGQGPDWR